MKICQEHWDKLRELINLEGLSSFISKDANEAMSNALKELNNESHDVDPLMICNNMIWSRSIETFGLHVIHGDNCPCCYANENCPKRDGEPTGDYWIRTLVPYVKKMFEEKGLLNIN